MSLYAVKRPGEQAAIMVVVDGADPMAEALKGGAVVDLMPITEAEAEVIRQSRPKPVAAPQEAPAGYVTREEFERVLASFAKDIVKAAGAA